MIQSGSRNEMSEDSGLFNNENFIAPLLVVDGHMVARKKSWSLYYYLQELVTVGD